MTGRRKQPANRNRLRMLAALHMISVCRTALSGDGDGVVLMTFARARDGLGRLILDDPKPGIAAMAAAAVQAVDIACEVTGADPDQVWTALRARLDIQE